LNKEWRRHIVGCPQLRSSSEACTCNALEISGAPRVPTDAELDATVKAAGFDNGGMKKKQKKLAQKD